MSDLKWIKFDVWLFDRAEFKYLAKKENGSELQLCWIRLLCEAAKRNDGGRIYISKRIPIDAEEVSILLDMKLDVVEEALFLFEACDLIKFDNEVGLVIRNFQDYVGEGFFEAEDGFLSGEPDSYTEHKMPSQAEKSAASNTEARKKIRDMTPDEKREYYRNKKKELRSRKSEDGQIDACPKENFEPVKNYLNVQNSHSDVQNTYSDVQNTCNGVQNYDTGNVQKEFGHTSQNVQNSPKNIFIEENRIDKSRIEDKRLDKTREEKENYNISSLSHSACEYVSENKEFSFDGDGISYFSGSSSEDSEALFNAYASRRLDFDNTGAVATLGRDNEISDSHTHTQKITEKRDKKSFGIFNNVYLSESELSDLNGRYGYEATKRLIGELSTKIESEGVSYKSHYATLIRWAECESSRAKSGNGNKGGDNNRNLRGGSNNCTEHNFNGGNTYGNGDCGGENYRERNGDYRNGDGGGNYGRGDNSSRNNGYAERKKGLQGEPYKPERKYGSFDAEEAFRLALERTEREWKEMGYTVNP